MIASAGAAETIVHSDHYDALLGELSTLVCGSGAEDERTAVNPDHDGEVRVLFGVGWFIDIQIQAILGLSARRRERSRCAHARPVRRMLRLTPA